MSRRKCLLSIFASPLLVVCLANCSSSDDESAPTTTAAPVVPPSSFAQRDEVVAYYVELGSSPLVAGCFADVLLELGVADPVSLEADQELSETVAGRFAVCTSTDGASSAES